MRTMRLLLVSTLITAFTSQARAVVISGIEVGDAGTVNVAECGPGGSAARKGCGAELALGRAYLLFDRSKTSNVEVLYRDDWASGAFVLSFNGGYFVAKNAAWHALFENKANLDWGVLTIAHFRPRMNLGGLTQTRISHVTELNGGIFTVPEPGPVALFGAALLALFGLGRRTDRMRRSIKIKVPARPGG